MVSSVRTCTCSAWYDLSSMLHLLIELASRMLAADRARNGTCALMLTITRQSYRKKGITHDGTCLNGDIPHSSISSNPVLWHDKSGWTIAESGCAGLSSSGGGRSQPDRLRHKCQRSDCQVVATRTTGL